MASSWISSTGSLMSGAIGPMASMWPASRSSRSAFSRIFGVGVAQVPDHVLVAG
jgi:hypothetical protein